MPVDITMTILSIILMGGTVLFPDDRVHQVLGMVLMVLWIVHTLLHRRWYGALFKGKYNPYRILQLVINLGITISCVLVMVSGMAMAWFLPASFGLNYARNIHLASSHWYYLFMCAHLGMHISMIANRIKAKHPETHHPVLLRFVSAVLLVYGIYAFFARGLWKYFFLTQQFFFLDLDKGYVMFAVDYMAILAAFAILIHLMAGALKRKMQ
ncbi:MAG: DUF4405 domain-containing protein [Spirochaetia bacterium]|nr:DUF4405 domain-containing protein [Spirochaetia bacterium]MBQ3712664.1 DUF4405 domain-containing protein [Spirochaetia bacterium]